jgi:preprotein translocase subunit SecA
MFRRRSTHRAIDAAVGAVRGLGAAELAERVRAMRDRAAPAADLLPDCLAVTAEAASRVTGGRPAEEDLAAGAELCAGAVLDERRLTDPALVLAVPTVLHAVAGGSAHLIAPTQQDAARRAAWLRPVAERLGLAVSLLEPGDDQETRRRHHRAEIVCGHVDEFAYDTLRDWLTDDPADRVLPAPHAAVVDHIDVVLLDRGDHEPRIAAPVAVDHDWHTWAADLAARLRPDEHVRVFGRSAVLTAAGFAEVLDDLDHDLADVHADHAPVLRLLNAALTARLVYRRGVDYEVAGDEVVVPGAPSHLVEALTVHEGLPLATVSTTLATTTVRRYVLRYPFRTGVGVLDPTAARCLREVTGLRVSPGDAASRGSEEVFVDDEARLRAVRVALETGRPVVLAAGTDEHRAGLPDGATVIGPADPVPADTDALLIGVGRGPTRRRDIRLAVAAGEVRWYLTEAEPTVADQLERELIRFYQDESVRLVADIRETHLDELTEYCAALFEGDAVGGFERILRGHVDLLVERHRGYYAGLRTAVARLYPTDLPEEPPASLKAAVRADADRALAARIREIEDLAGAATMPRLIHQVVRNVRDRNWRGHLADLETLSAVCGYSVPANRFRAEFTTRAARRFAELWQETIGDIVAYTFNVRLG